MSGAAGQDGLVSLEGVVRAARAYATDSEQPLPDNPAVNVTVPSDALEISLEESAERLVVGQVSANQVFLVAGDRIRAVGTMRGGLLQVCALKNLTDGSAYYFQPQTGGLFVKVFGAITALALAVACAMLAWDGVADWRAYGSVLGTGALVMGVIVAIAFLPTAALRLLPRRADALVPPPRKAVLARLFDGERTSSVLDI